MGLQQCLQSMSLICRIQKRGFLTTLVSHSLHCVISLRCLVSGSTCLCALGELQLGQICRLDTLFFTASQCSRSCSQTLSRSAPATCRTPYSQPGSFLPLPRPRSSHTTIILLAPSLVRAPLSTRPRTITRTLSTLRARTLVTTFRLTSWLTNLVVRWTDVKWIAL